jgi:tryptophan 2,3-dioxygenase
MSIEMHYGDYLQLDRILNAQQPESTRQNKPAHDEMLFIIIHQTYELWFRQLLYETESVISILKTPAINDNAPELQTVVHRLSRCVSILKVLVHQIDVMETMTPMDFLDFRDMLRPASGFQSWQFKVLEARLGLRYAQREGQDYYLSQLRPHEIAIIKQAEKEQSVLELLNGWLERMPFFEEQENWKNFHSAGSAGPVGDGEHVFWSEYRKCYQESLVKAEADNITRFDETLATVNPRGQEFRPGATSGISSRASRAALFIMLYRGYPILHLPFQLLTQLLEIDEQLSTWRYRHMNMVQRTIGSRIGTGSSTGRDYLKGALDKHYIFRDLASLTSFLIERRRLPRLTREMERRLGFVGEGKMI